NKPFVTLFANWETAELASGQKVPSEYTFRMEPGVAAGGQVVDEQGKPVAGARVRVRLGANLKPIRGDGRAGYSSPLTANDEPATTDAKGRWRIDNVPDHPKLELRLLVSHPY